MSLRAKVVLSICFTFFILMVSFVMPMIYKEHRMIEEETKATALSHARMIAMAASKAIEHKDLTFLKNLVENRNLEKSIEYVLIEDAEGKVLVTSHKQLEEKILQDPLSQLAHTTMEEKIEAITPQHGDPFHGRASSFEVMVPIVEGGKKKGVIRLGFSTKEARERIASATWSGLKITSLAILVGVAIALIVDRQLRKALLKFIEGTKRMADGDLSQQVEVKTGDELETLAESFNRMAFSLGERERELAETKQTLQSIFDGIWAGITYISHDFRIIMVNQYQGFMRGKEPRELIGRFCFKELADKDEPCPFCPGVLAMTTGRREEVESSMLLGDGRCIEAHIDAYPVFDGDNRPLGFIKHVQDVTMRKNLERELKRHTEHLEGMVEEKTTELKESQDRLIQHEKMVGLGQLAAGLAHELNTPLGTILGSSQLLKEVIADEENLSDIMRIEEQAQRCKKIVQNLLDFSRKSEDKKVPGYINNIIKKTVALVEHNLKLKKIKIHYLLDESLPSLKVNENEIQQVLFNLISNAADAMPEGGEIQIESRYDAQGGLAIIQVKDQGCGIEESNLQRIFDPFFTTKEVGKGTGLGLAICYRIVNEHGGNIKVSSKMDQGSTFTITLPYGGTKGP